MLIGDSSGEQLCSSQSRQKSILSCKVLPSSITKVVFWVLEDCIGNEDKRKPLTDEKLTEILKEQGYNIARRTVAKYREQMNIPVARLRKEL